jgi:hypothetical protein
MSVMLLHVLGIVREGRPDEHRDLSVKVNWGNEYFLYLLH